MREIVYQFFNPREGINFFTTSRAERDELLNSDPSFDFLGSSYLGADPANDDSESVFKLFNESTGEYFYTISATERDVLLEDPNFVDRGVAFAAFGNDGEQRTPVYRFQNTVTG
ncbi:MAG: serine protease, partial [Cyanobacteria bacterium J06553_1]